MRLIEQMERSYTVGMVLLWSEGELRSRNVQAARYRKLILPNVQYPRICEACDTSLQDAKVKQCTGCFQTWVS